MKPVLIAVAVPRMQFYAVEIARCVPNLFLPRGYFLTLRCRNRRGLNDWIYEQAHPGDEKEEEKASS
jgi:hypothetical protein